MNKFKKVAMMAMSAVMCASVSVGVALTTVSADSTEAKGITTILAEQVLGASKTAGATSVQYVKDKELTSGGAKVSGLELTGKAGTVFDLGEICLKDFSWTDSTTYDSFIDYVITPKKDATVAELSQMDIILTDAVDTGRYFTIRVQRYNTTTGTMKARATIKGEGSQEWASWYAGTTTNTNIYINSGNIYKLNPHLHDTTATSVKPVSLVYDAEENAVYTPNANLFANQQGKTNLIRGFDDEGDVYAKQDDLTVKSQKITSCAFNEEGRFNLSVKINALDTSVTQASLVVTKFAGIDLTGNESGLSLTTDALTNAKVQINGEDATSETTVTVGDTVSLMPTDGNKTDFKSMTVNGVENTTGSFTVTLDMFKNNTLTVGGAYGTKYAITVDGESETLWDIESYTLPTLENGIGYGLTGGGVYQSGETVTELSKTMEFTSLTVGVKANTQLSLAASNANSGLRFVTQINQADLTKLDEYTDITFYAYLTLKEAFETKCSGKEFLPENINYDENAVQAGMNDEIASTDGYKLKVLKLTQADTERWMSKGVDEGYVGFCMTLVELYADHFDDEYLFLPVIEISYANGEKEQIALADATDFAGSVKSLAETLIADDSLYGESGQVYQYEVTVGGETKYSIYDEARLKVLYTWAGNTTVIGKENA